MHTNIEVALEPNFMNSYLLTTVFLLYIFFNHSRDFKSS